MVAEPGIPTIDQLKVLLMVVETGSFTAAAKRLNRAVSAISYTIAALEQQLGIELFVGLEKLALLRLCLGSFRICLGSFRLELRDS